MLYLRNLDKKYFRNKSLFKITLKRKMQSFQSKILWMRNSYACFLLNPLHEHTYLLVKRVFYEYLLAGGKNQNCNLSGLDNKQRQLRK